MTELLKELAHEAGLPTYNPDGIPTKLEKFAELIVRECARIAARTPFPDTDEYIRKTYGHTWDMACVESAKDIREHFGIE